MSLPQPEQFEEFYRAATLAIAEMGIAQGQEKEPNYKPDTPPAAKDPFPWQKRLARRVCAGEWPRIIALPTAAGKTACIDVAVFALACRAKDAPRRIFFVVDRRIVVDQAKMHADGLAKVLQNAQSGVLKDVADSLREIAQDERPLDVYALRGGMYRETAWARSPLQPTVIPSTVDQVGSRLLFRGYGVTDSMKPIHAALVGNDALVLLDEAHCAKPFEQTMRAVEKYRGWHASPVPFHFVSLTATPRDDVPTERDEEDDRNDPILGKRIDARKPATLVVAEKAKGKKATTELVAVLETHARALAEQFTCVGIIVNRVKTARELKAKLGGDAVLLTGRMRPLDRDRLLGERLKPVFANAEGIPPKFVIGTQCLECGADFDFHALVSECASLDALRQRFGRLNRVANRPTAKAVIVIRADQIEPKDKESERDPVYGNALPETWKWLKSRAKDDVFDFGISAVRTAIDGVELGPLNAPAAAAPVLFPAHLDCWVQTNPKPMPDPDPALFLHGPAKSGQPDVQVVFRNDLGEEPEKWVDIVSLIPPSSSEAVSVPIAVFRQWLAGRFIEDQSGDVEGEATNGSQEEPINRSALHWRGAEKSGIVNSANGITPSGVYVIPCNAEGVEALGDFPFGLTDYAEQAFQRSRDKAVLRLMGSTLTEDADDFDELLTEEIQAQLKDDSPEWLKTAIEALKNPKRRDFDPHPLGGCVVTGKARLRQFEPTYLDDSEPSESFRGSRPITLVEHSSGVAEHARRFAKNCGLDAELYYQAGLWHDVGKLDPRFQAMLKQSSPRTAVGIPLAKSARPPRTKQEREEARQIHHYPSGARHELLSAALVAKRTDDDFLLHLIATHHGSARPFADPVEENEAKRPFRTELFGQPFDLPTCEQQIAAWNAELPERFWRIIRKYGWWGAAYRETIFRLADHAQSRAEQEGKKEMKREPVMLPSFTQIAELRPVYPLELTGLEASNPLAFLAAVGTLRLADELFPGAKMTWKRQGGWRPVLELPFSLSLDEFLSRLCTHIHRVADPTAVDASDDRHKEYRELKKQRELALKSVKERKLRGNEREQALAVEVVPLEAQEQAARSRWLQALDKAVPAPFLSLGKSIAVNAEEFAAFAERTADRMYTFGSVARGNADFCPAFGSESCVDRNGRVIPTEFQLITGSGHQFFLETFGVLMESVTISQLKRSLLGPWNYNDSRFSFRWDPLDDRRYALSWNDPSSMEVRTEHAANLLAAFALPLFPVAPTLQGARTTGFHNRFGEPRFTWPIWNSSYSVDSVRSLLGLGRLHASSPQSSKLTCLGVCAVFRVRKVEVGQPPLSKLNLGPAVLV